MRFREAYKFFQNPRLYKEYPQMIASFSKMLFSQGDHSDERILGLLLRSTKSTDLTVGRLASDILRSQKLL